jgi:pyruvate formate lyase activating enzyme
MSRIVTAPPVGPPRREGKPGGWWHERDDGRIVCDLCPRACALKDGDRGFCFVRQNVGGEMLLTTYGLSTGFCIDPIEKKPLNHFFPGTSVLSFGTAGCNLGCKFCQNWSISKSREAEQLSERGSPEEIAEAAVRLGCRSVAFTYNDPVIWAEYAIDTANACRDRGIKTVVKTSGYITPVARPGFFGAMDAANVDLKAFTEEFYSHLTLSHLQPVLDTLRWLKEESNVWFEVTNLIIPGENDSAEETERMCEWLVENVGAEVPVHFTAFHPDFRMRDRPSTPPETLTRACKIARRAGLQFVYTGNVHDPEGQSTYCPRCGTTVIERDGYEILEYYLVAGRCASCGESILGCFDEIPGDWGSRRLPVEV